MIRVNKVVVKAVCDACGARLSTEGQTGPDGHARGVHYGSLKNHFGFGSDLDGIDNVSSSLDLCDDCYLKCLAALRVPISQYRVPEYHLKTVSDARLVENDEPSTGQTGKDIYHVRGWGCVFCNWRDTQHGLAIPDHRCEAVKKIDHEREARCAYCKGEHPEFEFSPAYSERADAWVHYLVRVQGQGDEPAPCQISDFILALMRDGERIDSELKKKLRAGEFLKQLRAEKRKRGESEGKGGQKDGGN